MLSSDMVSIPPCFSSTIPAVLGLPTGFHGGVEGLDDQRPVEVGRSGVRLEAAPTRVEEGHVAVGQTSHARHVSGVATKVRLDTSSSLSSPTASVSLIPPAHLLTVV